MRVPSSTDTTGYLGGLRHQRGGGDRRGRRDDAVHKRLLVGAATSGVVRDSSHHPLAGIAVVAETRAGDFALATTASNGTYTLTGLPGHSVQTCAENFTTPQTATGDLGYAPACQTVTLAAAATVPSPDLVMPVGGAVTGILTTSTGAPLVGAEVDVNLRQNGTFALTDAHGRYTVSSLAAGKYGVCFSASTYVSLCHGNVSPENGLPNAW